MRTIQEQYNRPAVLIIFLIIGASYLFMITRTTLWDRDEPRFARASVEMVETGNHLVPTFNGQLWADKPVLVYWLMGVSIRLFGNSEFACRFWSASGTAISCLLTFYLGKKLFGTREGLWAMIILASSTMMLAVGTMATADGTTLPLILAAMAIFVHAMTSGLGYYHVILIGTFMGLGMLAKGPIGLLPLPVMLITLWFTRKNYSDFFRQSTGVFAALLIAVILFLVWAIKADKATNGQFLNTFIGKHVITRAFKPMEHHGGNFLLYLPYYLPVIVGGFFPWTIFLPSAFSALIGNRLGPEYSKKLLLIWIISIVAIMTLAATKLPHYIIFIWPALALLSASVIVASKKNVLVERDIKWLSRGNWFFVPVGLIAGTGMISMPFFLKIPGLMIPAIMCGIIMLLITLSTDILLHHSQITTASILIIIGLVIFHIPYLTAFLPAIENVKVSPSISNAINKATTANTPVATYKFREPSLNYYLGKNLYELSDLEEVISWIKKQKKAAVLVIPADEFEKLKQSYENLSVKLILSKKGMNYSKGKPIELLALLYNQGEI